MTIFQSKVENLHLQVENTLNHDAQAPFDVNVLQLS